MRNEDIIYAVQEIEEAGRVTSEIKSKYFSGYKFGEIRDWLEKNGLDRHTALELTSTEIAIITPFGVLMQIRPLDLDQLGVWGGVLNEDEDPADGAVRELKEETGIVITKDQLEYVEIDEHFHQYDNGDKAYFMSYRYTVTFDHVPKITTDEESVGVFMVPHVILSHQQDFIRQCLMKIKN